MNPTTADRYVIRPGLRVWTNDLERGTVSETPPRLMPDPWFLVSLDNGGTELQNGDRMSVRHPITGEKA